MTDLIDEMITADELCSIIGGKNSPIHITTLYRWIKAGKIPRPLKLSHKLTRWRRSDINVALNKIIENGGAAP